MTVPTISQVTVPNRFIRIGRDGSISYSQAPIPLNLRTHIPHPFFPHLLMCSCSIEVEQSENERTDQLEIREKQQSENERTDQLEIR